MMLGRSLASISKRSAVLRSSVTQRNVSCALASKNGFFSQQEGKKTSTNIRPMTKMPFSSAAVSVSDEDSAQNKSVQKAPTSVQEPVFVPTAERKYAFFQNVEITPDGIAMIRFDNPAKKVNTISFKVKDEAEKLWTSRELFSLLVNLMVSLQELIFLIFNPWKIKRMPFLLLNLLQTSFNISRVRVSLSCVQLMDLL